MVRSGSTKIYRYIFEKKGDSFVARRTTQPPSVRNIILYSISIILVLSITIPISWHEFSEIQFSFSDFSSFMILVAEISYNIFFPVTFTVCFTFIAFYSLAFIVEWFYDAIHDRSLSCGAVAVLSTIAFVVIYLLFMHIAIGPFQESDLEKERNNFDITSDYVYITETGEKYHLYNCPALKSIEDELSVDDAEGEGYDPCKICDPLGIY